MLPSCDINLTPNNTTNFFFLGYMSVAYCRLFPTKAQNPKFSHQGALNTRSPTLPVTRLTYVGFLD